jgi:transcriptional regulator with XRE-family HTH domain
MSNRIYDLVEEMKVREGITYRDIAERFGIPEQTLHSSRKRDDMGRIGIDVFLKIAHGLGMTAEELYYGTEREAQEQPSISPDEQIIVDAYRIADTKQKRHMLSTAQLEIEMANEDAREKKEVI